MVSKAPPGTCLLCKAPVTKRKVLKHSMECLQTSGWRAGKHPSFLIMIQGHYNKSYWLVVLARHDARLGDLDQLIRDVWVECCGHLSSFLIEEVIYESDAECSTDAMDVPLSHVLTRDSTFSYDYDFGSTTSLDLKVIGETPVAPRDSQLCLIARNDRPVISCDRCGDTAEFTRDDLEEEGPRYYCRKCLQSVNPDHEWVDTIANSPRNGICGYAEDPIAALRWYPPGWSAGEIAPEEPDETAFDAEVESSALAAVVQDIGPDINAFVEAEDAAYGERAACMAGESVVAFCTFMYGHYGLKIEAWDVRSVLKCLVEDLVQNPTFPDDWPEKAVSILSRFLIHMEASGRLANAQELITAMKEVEPAFQEVTTSPEKSHALFKQILMSAREAGIDIDDLDAFFNFAMREIIWLTGIDPDNEEIWKDISNQIRNEPLVLDVNELRTTTIFTLCEEFCDRFEDGAILDHCRETIEKLHDHPATPLVRGDAVLWGAAIVYAACQNADLIRPGKGGSSIAKEISFFFGIERSSIRNKVTALKKYLSDR
jgi:hypothetical protein